MDPLDGGRWQVESYLDHHGDKLAHRFDAGSYVTLTEAMNGHDLGRGRGGVEAALAAITADTVVVGVDSDRLYPLEQQERLVAGIKGAARSHVVRSPHGHDGFLIEKCRGGARRGRLGPPSTTPRQAAERLLRSGRRSLCSRRCADGCSGTGSTR